MKRIAQTEHHAVYGARVWQVTRVQPRTWKPSHTRMDLSTTTALAHSMQPLPAEPSLCVYTVAYHNPVTTPRRFAAQCAVLVPRCPHSLALVCISPHFCGSRPHTLVLLANASLACMYPCLCVWTRPRCSVQPHPNGGSTRIRAPTCTYAPWGVRVVSLSKSRKVPTRRILPLFPVTRACLQRIVLCPHSWCTPPPPSPRAAPFDITANDHSHGPSWLFFSGSPNPNTRADSRWEQPLSLKNTQKNTFGRIGPPSNWTV